MGLHVRDCNSIEKWMTWGRPLDSIKSQTYLSMTPSYFSIDLWSYQLGNQCLLGQLHFNVFFRTLYLDSIETHVFTPIEKHLFGSTSGPAFFIEQDPQYPQYSTAFERLMALNSIELTPCIWTFFPYLSQFYRVKK